MATPPVIIIIGGHAYHFTSVTAAAVFAQKVAGGTSAGEAYVASQAS